MFVFFAAIPTFSLLRWIITKNWGQKLKCEVIQHHFHERDVGTQTQNFNWDTLLRNTNHSFYNICRVTAQLFDPPYLLESALRFWPFSVGISKKSSSQFFFTLSYISLPFPPMFSYICGLNTIFVRIEMKLINWFKKKTQWKSIF